MNQKNKAYLKSMILLSVIVIMGTQALGYFNPNTINFKHFWTISAVLVLGAYLSNIFIEKSYSNPGKSFVQFTMLLTVLRLTLYGIFVFILIYFTPGKIKNDIIYFASFYFLLTIHEVLFIAFGRRLIEND